MPQSMISESSKPKISLLVADKSKPMGNSSSYVMSSSNKMSTATNRSNSLLSSRSGGSKIQYSFQK